MLYGLMYIIKLLCCCCTVAVYYFFLNSHVLFGFDFDLLNVSKYSYPNLFRTSAFIQLCYALTAIVFCIEKYNMVNNVLVLVE